MKVKMIEMLKKSRKLHWILFIKDFRIFWWLHCEFLTLLSSFFAPNLVHLFCFRGSSCLNQKIRFSPANQNHFPISSPSPWRAIFAPPSSVWAAAPPLLRKKHGISFCFHQSDFPSLFAYRSLHNSRKRNQYFAPWLPRPISLVLTPSCVYSLSFSFFFHR